MDLQLNDKIVLVTAASRGLGKATALQFAREGAKVAISARSEELYRAAADIQTQTGAEILPLQADINQPAGIDRTIQQTVDKWGGLDILVTNCGGPPAGTFDDINTEQWQTSINQILLSAVRLIKAALPHLRQSAAPAILTITSVSAKQPIPNLILSNSLRAGILGLTKTLSQELAPDAIRVNSILPGPIATDRQQELIAAQAAKSGKPPEKTLAETVASIPLGRSGKPEEFANVAVFLCSPAAAFVTGAMVPVDGGISRGIL